MLRMTGLKILLLTSFLLAGCMDDGANKNQSEEPKPIPKLSQLTGSELLPNTPFVAIDDDLAFLASIGRDIVFQKGTKKTVIESGKGGTHRLWLQYDGRYLYALWWRKFNAGKGKQLFVSVSKDKGASFGQIKVINSKYAVLPTVRIASDPSGKVLVTWHDERDAKTLQIYANYSSDAGVTWQEQDVRVDQDAVLPMTVGERKAKSLVSTAAEPFVFMVEGHKAVVIWQQVDTLDSIPSLSINARTYDFKNTSWSKIQKIYQNENESGVTYSAAQYNDNILVMVSLSGKGVIASLSTDSGGSWDYLGSNYEKGKLAKEAHSGWLKALGSGDNFYVWTTLEKNTVKETIDMSTISLSEKKWVGSPKRFDSGKDNKTRSGRQIAVKLSDGIIIVAWVDFRNILPAVYLNLSKDSGKTWLKNPKILSTPGYQSIQLVDVVAGDNKAWIISSRLGSDGKKLNNTLLYQTITVENNGKISFSDIPVDRIRLSKEKMKARLEKRVKEFWKLRKEKNWEASWEYFDPLYRLKFGKQNWLATQGQIRFGDFKLTGVDIEDDTFALTSGEVEVGINLQQREAGVLEAAPYKKQQAGMRWGWFYDDWYFMPEVFFMKIHDY